MKLNNHLIVTLSDFARHFDFAQFWLNRRQFVRDMGPDKVYYWSDELVEAYHIVKIWIENNQSNDKAQREKGLNALDLLLGGTLDRSTVTLIEGCQMDMKQDIWVVQAGQSVDLPPYTGKSEGTIHLRLHKIEVSGAPSETTRISIGGKLCAILNGEEAVYVTELDGGCIELLPNHQRNAHTDLSLLSLPGGFRSTLVVRDLHSDNKLMFDGVVSFALLDDGYIYIDQHQKPVYMMTHVPKFMLKHDGKALYVKAKGDTVMVLYEDGTLKSTTSMEPMTNIVFPKIDPSGNIITTNL